MSLKLSRKDFLRVSAAGAGTLLFPEIISAAPSAAPKKKTAANDFINMAFIGLGQQAIHLMNGFKTLEDVRVVAGCDVYDIKRERFYRQITNYYAEKGIRQKVDMYVDFEDVLARPDIDAVVIATPDHQHARIAIAACKAGKDVYLEKPMTFTIYEGQRLVEAVRANNRILQVGSMQRSSAEFIHAANICREGVLGKISFMRVRTGATPYPAPLSLEPQEVPAGLDWDKWLGPLAADWKYNHELNPLIVDGDRDECWGAWRWYEGIGGGYMTDWGAHMFDIGQWAIGKDCSGPVEIIPASASHYGEATFVYDNGIQMVHGDFDGGKNGIKIYGENGWIQAVRGELKASSPDLLPNEVDQRKVYETNVPHYRTFVDSIKSRRDPNVPVEVGHSSCTVCNLGLVAYYLNRPIKWNPIVQKFVNDPEAEKNLHYHYEYRKPYTLE
ncbi:MAG: Gfo/Idh/MocA family oxidoreductase [Bacteroidales bacterium]|nr:Gfo/Idh/MocA family oxidoreductase [Bacteroidales bacterium]